ncbi:MAG TPA: xanthine dehydrogenase family protein subunit M [Conexibacter sp.]|nr:xanthine dehydrogenase family protein subunit M [Conexibacter sp.]
MKPAPFIYHAPEQLDELLSLLAADDVDGRVIAGGQSLVPMMNFRLSTPERLVDIRRVEELRGLCRLPDGGLAIGAAVTQAQLLRDRAVTADFPLLAEAIGHIGHPQIRSRGTICGSLAHHDPTAELPALALALDARMTIRSANGSRELSAADFFVSYYETALEYGELLAEVTFPAPRPRAGWSFRELARRRGDFALVGAVALVERGAQSRLVLFGVGDRARRIEPVERLLGDAPAFDADLLAQIPELVAAAIDPLGDVHASADYRRELAGELAVAAITEAIERAA